MHLRTVIHTEAMHGIMNIFSANLLTLQTYLRQSIARAQQSGPISPSHSSLTFYIDASARHMKIARTRTVQG